MAKRAVDNSELERWRSLPSVVVLRSALCEHAKPDPTFCPIESQDTSRWHVSAGGRDFELLCTGSKFYDTRAKKGGGGAIDLAMHLYALDFKGAVQRLRQAL
ncbi:MAG: hypothetical protein EB072_09580 [Betaproteobacteria bacterium]|nr:hypothetical protein [Betaproteobacteria bacterium]